MKKSRVALFVGALLLAFGVLVSQGVESANYTVQRILNAVLVDDSITGIISEQQAFNAVYDEENAALRIRLDDPPGDVLKDGDLVEDGLVVGAGAASIKKLEVPEQRLLGRKTGGNVGPLSAEEARAILNVEDGAKDDQTGAEIKASYEGEADTNAFTDTLKSKLDGVEESADVTDAANVAAAGATMNTDADVSGNSWVLDQDDMADDSNTKVPTQQSVKAFIEANSADLGVLEAAGAGMDISIASNSTINVSAGHREINGTMYFATGQLTGSISTVPLSHGSDECSGGSVTCSSEDSGYGVANSAFDNNTGTAWGADTDSNEWIQYDFGEGNAKTIRTFRVLPALISDHAGIKNATLKGSNNGTDFVTLTTVVWPDEGDWQDDLTGTTFSNDTAYRYIRLEIADVNTGAPRVYMREIEFTEGDFSLTASTTYHVYCDEPPGATALTNDSIVFSTTGYTFDSAKGARYRSDDTTQLWIGSFTTDAAGDIEYIIQPRMLNIRTDSGEEPDTGQILRYADDYYYPTYGWDFEAKTLTDSGFSVSASDNHKIFRIDISGLTADGAAILPEASTVPGFEVGFLIQTGDDTYDFQADPNDATDKIIGTSAAGDYLAADDADDILFLRAVGDDRWQQFDVNGTWTEE